MNAYEVTVAGNRKTVLANDKEAALAQVGFENIRKAGSVTVVLVKSNVSVN